MNNTLIYWPARVECPECRLIQMVDNESIDAAGPFARLTECHGEGCSRYVNNTLSSRFNPPRLVISKKEYWEWNPA